MPYIKNAAGEPVWVGSRPVEYSYNDRAQPNARFTTVAVPIPDAMYRAERGGPGGQSLLSSIPGPDKFRSVGGEQHDRAEVVSYHRLSANAWAVDLGARTVRVNLPNFDKWMGQ